MKTNKTVSRYEHDATDEPVRFAACLAIVIVEVNRCRRTVTVRSHCDGRYVTIATCRSVRENAIL